MESVSTSNLCWKSTNLSTTGTIRHESCQYVIPPLAGSTDDSPCLLVLTGQEKGYPAMSYPQTGLSRHALVALAWIDAFTSWDLPRLHSYVTSCADDFRYEYRPRTMGMPTKTLGDWKEYTRRLMHMLPDFWVRYSPRVLAGTPCSHDFFWRVGACRARDCPMLRLFRFIFQPAMVRTPAETIRGCTNAFDFCSGWCWSVADPLAHLADCWDRFLYCNLLNMHRTSSRAKKIRSRC